MRSISGLRKTNNNALFKAMLNLSGLSFLLPLWESSGLTAYDYSGNGLHGTYNGVTLAQPGVNARLPLMASFDGINDFITPAAGCSVKNKSVWSWVGVIEITGDATQYPWWESLYMIANTARFVISCTNKTLTVGIRPKSESPTISSFIQSVALSNGKYLCGVNVDISNKSIVLYINGAIVTGTLTVNWDTATAIDPPDPSTLYIGKTGVDTAWYAGDLACVGMYNRLLSTEEHLYLARMGGFV